MVQPDLEAAYLPHARPGQHPRLADSHNPGGSDLNFSQLTGAWYVMTEFLTTKP